MKRKSLWIGIGTLTAFLAIIAALIFIDPFGWRILDRLQGNSDLALTAMPSETAVYLGVDLLQFISDDWQAIFAQFSAADGGDAQNDFEQSLNEQLGISFSEDVQPWVGPSFGVALLDVQADLTGNVTSVQWVAAAETRNRADTDAFLAKLAAGWAKMTGETAVSETYQNINITLFNSETPANQLAFGRDDNLLLIGSDLFAIQSALDARKDVSLANTSGFTELEPTLVAPWRNGGRLATLYLNTPRLGRLQSALPLSFGSFVLPALPTNGVLGTAVSVSLHEGNIQLDVNTAYNLTQLGTAQTQLFQTQSADQTTINSLPVNTLLYANGEGIDQLWSLYREAFINETSDSDFEDSMALLKQQFGLNPNSDLFPFLDGTTTLALVPSDIAEGGSVPQLAQAQLDAVLAIDSSDGAILSQNIADFSQRFDATIGTVGETAVNGFTNYTLETALLSDFMLHYSVGHDQFIIATSPNALLTTQSTETATPFANSATFQTAWSAFPTDMTPGLYVDVAGLLTHLQTVGQETSGSWNAITQISGASQTTDSQTHQRIIFFLPTD